MSGVPTVVDSRECALFVVVSREGVADIHANIDKQQAAGYLRRLADLWDPSGDQDAFADRDNQIAQLKTLRDALRELAEECWCWSVLPGRLPELTERAGELLGLTR